MREVELKLGVHGSFQMPALEQTPGVHRVEELPPLDMRTTYHDTPELRLARHGITLRYRTGEDGGSKWTLKLPVPGEDGTNHDEFHFEGPPGRVPEAARDLVIAYVRRSLVGSVSTVRTRRHRWMLFAEDETEVAEVSDDEVSIMEGSKVVGRFRELEIEARTTDVNGLTTISQVVQEAGALPSEPIPKAVRAMGARATAAPDVVVPEEVGPKDPAALAVQASLSRGVKRLILHDPGVRAGGDPEAVHQMRVAARRLRSDLKTFGPLIQPEWADRLGRELRWIGEVLGPVRDLDVLRMRLVRLAADLGEGARPIFMHIDREHRTATMEALSELRSERYVAVLEQLVEAARDPALTAFSADRCRDALPPLVAAAYKKLARVSTSVSEEDPDEDFHEVRKKAKQARYAAEAVGPVLESKDAKDAKRFAKGCTALQDTLGAMQDAVVSRALIERALQENPDDARLGVAAGRLLEREDASRRRSKEGFAAGWRSVSKGRNLRWFQA